MYIDKLSTWTPDDWEKYFSYINISDDKLRLRIVTILCGSKDFIELHFDELHEYCIINGVGPSWFFSSVRKLISKLFPYVRYEWHDIKYSIGGDETDRFIADDGLLKYTIKSIREPFIDIMSKDLGPLERLVILLVITAFSPLHLFIGILFYGFVRAFGKFSFRYTK